MAAYAPASAQATMAAYAPPGTHWSDSQTTSAPEHAYNDVESGGRASAWAAGPRPEATAAAVETAAASQGEQAPGPPLPRRGGLPVAMGQDSM